MVSLAKIVMVFTIWARIDKALTLYPSPFCRKATPPPENKS